MHFRHFLAKTQPKNLNIRRTTGYVHKLSRTSEEKNSRTKVTFFWEHYLAKPYKIWMLKDLKAEPPAAGGKGV